MKKRKPGKLPESTISGQSTPPPIEEPDTDSIESFALMQSTNPGYKELIIKQGVAGPVGPVSMLCDMDGCINEKGLESLLKRLKAKGVVERRKDETRSAFKVRAVQELSPEP